MMKTVDVVGQEYNDRRKKMTIARENGSRKDIYDLHKLQNLDSLGHSPSALLHVSVNSYCSR